MKTVVDAVNELRADAASGEHTAKVNYFGFLGFDEDGEWVACERNYSLIVCSIKEFNQCVAEMSEAKWITESKPVFTQAMADAGELPPVGCDYLDECGQLCLCIGYSIEKGFVVGQMVEHPSSNGYPPISTSEKTCVKPIKTEREKAIDDVTGDWPMADKSTIEVMYDLGYRKLTQSQAKSYDDKAGYFSEGSE